MAATDAMMPRLGLMIGFENTPFRPGIDLARLADQAGFDSVWVPDFYRSYSVSLAAVAEATTRVRLGTNVSMGFSRSPYMGARVAADLDELSEGRLMLGLGTGFLHPGREDGWRVGRERRERPTLSALQDLVEAYRYSWRTWHDTPGADLDYKTEHSVLRVGGDLCANQALRRAIPVHLGVRQPRAMQFAGEIGDGLVLFPLASRRHVREEVRPNLAIGAERAGRNVADVELSGMVVCCISKDRAEARRLARRQLGAYAVEGGAIPMSALERDGFGDQWKRLWELREGRDLAAIEAGISDEMLDTYAVAGERDEVRDRIRELRDTFDSVILEPPRWGLSQEQVLAAQHAVIEALAC